MHSTIVASVLLTQQPRFDSKHSQNIFRWKIIDFGKVSFRRWLEESGQRLDNVEWTHLFLACGNQVQQKNYEDVAINYSIVLLSASFYCLRFWSRKEIEVQTRQSPVHVGRQEEPGPERAEEEAEGHEGHEDDDGGLRTSQTSGKRRGSIHYPLILPDRMHWLIKI